MILTWPYGRFFMARKERHTMTEKTETPEVQNVPARVSALETVFVNGQYVRALSAVRKDAMLRLCADDPGSWMPITALEQSTSPRAHPRDGHFFLVQQATNRDGFRFDAWVKEVEERSWGDLNAVLASLHPHKFYTTYLLKRRKL